jgi:nucleoside 2-deoxyribosyltransferase
MIKVYLAGGFKSNWQAKVVEACADRFTIFNPRDHGLENTDYYTAWDIHFVKNCDIFFAYMESTNPSGYGLTFELGIAFALNKTIILVDEKSLVDKAFARYFKIVHRPSSVVIDNLEEGIIYLLKFAHR